MTDDVISDEQIEAAVRFWDGYFMINDKREAFSNALREVLKEQQAEGKTRVGGLAFGDELYVDYDPQGWLLEAVQRADIKCAGYMFSARGLFSCQKTGVYLQSGKVEAKEGYGSDWVEIWPVDRRK